MTGKRIKRVYVPNPEHEKLVDEFLRNVAVDVNLVCSIIQGARKLQRRRASLAASAEKKRAKS